MSFLAGPGFRVVEGGAVTWSGADGGLLPMVPVLAALPQPGAFPWFVALSVLVVVAVGAFVARRALAEVARLSRLRTKLVGVGRGLPDDGAGSGRRSTSSPAARSASSALGAVGAPAGSLCPRPVPRAVRSVRSSWCSATRGGCAGDAPPPTWASSSSSRAPGATSRRSSTPRPPRIAGFRVLAVGADRDGTGGARARRGAGIPTFVARVPDYVTRADWDLDLARLIGEHEPDLVVSAGFMKVLGPVVLGAHRVVNTHPALLPSFPGAHGVRDAMAHGVKVTGCTCHWVDAGVDTGPIIDQRAVRVRTTTPSTPSTSGSRSSSARCSSTSCGGSRPTAPGATPDRLAPWPPIPPTSRRQRARS